MRQWILKATEAIWGAFTVAAVLLAIAVLAGAHCTREMALRTALDVASCAAEQVARQAAPIMGQVAGLVLGTVPQVEAEAELRRIGVEASMAAVLCALDRLIMDLGGPPDRHASQTAAGQAAARAATLRRALEVSP